MNAPSRQNQPTINQWLQEASITLQKKGVASAPLDARIIIRTILAQPHSWIIAHGDELISPDDQSQANKWLNRRAKREPLAYIIGYREFYGRKFIVTPDVLIPRPESEQIINTVLSLNLPSHPIIADIGTGSGCLAITIKCELPNTKVYGLDVSTSALEIASKNTHALLRGANNIHFIESDLTQKLPETVDCIIANLPYVAAQWNRSIETNYEPPVALYAADDGLSIIYRLISESNKDIAKSGYLLLEADSRQHESIIAFASKNGLKHQNTYDLCLLFQR